MFSQQQISNRQRETLDISVTDLEEFCSTEERFRDFVSDIQSNARRYISIFSEAADDLMPESTFSVAEEDSFDVLMRQREQAEVNTLNPEDSAQRLPDVLRRRFRVYFKPGAKCERRNIRGIRAADIGHLVTFKGICTRVGDVKPLIEVACFACDGCGFEIYQVRPAPCS